MRRLLKFGVPQNPCTFFARGNGNLIATERNGDFSLTASGALRYGPGNKGFWVEEGTTNTVPDPIFGNAAIGNGWAAVGSAVMTRDASIVSIGPASGQAACTASTSDGIEQLSTTGGAALTAQTWTLSGQVQANSAGDVGKTVNPVIIERTSANASVAVNTGPAITLTLAPQDFAYTVTLSGGATTAKVTGRIVNGAASTVTFNVLQLQLEQKAYATSLCAGSLGTGYTWAGTAHASASTRAVTLINHSSAVSLNPVSGSFFVGFSRSVISGVASYAYMSGGNGSVGQDLIAAVIASDGRWALRTKSNGGTDSTMTMGSPISDTAHHSGYASWTADMRKSSLDGSAYTTSARPTPPVGAIFLPSQIGSASSSNQLNGLIGPIAIFDRPLTDAELAKVSAAMQDGTISFTTLKHLA